MSSIPIQSSIIPKKTPYVFSKLSFYCILIMQRVSILIQLKICMQTYDEHVDITDQFQINAFQK